MRPATIELMIRIFYGADTFSKEQELNSLVKISEAESFRILENGPFPELEKLNGTVLFGPSQIFIFDNSIAKSGLLENVAQLLNATAEIVILENSLPKKTGSLAELSKSELVKIKIFDPPELSQIPAWIEKRAQIHGATISKPATELMLEVLVPEPAAYWEKPVVDLTLLDNELQKLVAYCDGREISEDAVSLLVKKNNSIDVWHVINAIADKNSKKVFTALDKFMTENDSAGDDKAKLIMLNALMADQFRNILIMQDFQTRRTSDQEVLLQTGWKSGRLYQLRKICSRFTGEKVKVILKRLEDMDIELKTSSTPARPIMDLILAQIL